MRNKTQSGRALKEGNRISGAAEFWQQVKATLYRPIQIWVDGGWDHVSEGTGTAHIAKGTRAPGSMVSKRKPI